MTRRQTSVETISVHVPFTIRKYGGRKRVVVPSEIVVVVVISSGTVVVVVSSGVVVVVVLRSEKTTLTGEYLSSVVPSPSWLLLFLPQAQTVPSLFKAMV